MSDYIKYALQELEERDSAEASLSEFIKQSWHVLHPTSPYIHNWHIDAIAEHLTAITNGKITRLLVNVPPGSLKSLLVNVFWPAWEWGAKRMPEMSYLCAAHMEKLAIRDNMKMRRLVSSEWYKNRYPHIILTSDRNSKSNFENTETGFREAMAIGSLTGSRAHRVTCLPYNAKIWTSDGLISIGEIVEKKLDVLIAGTDLKTITWQKIENYEKNEPRTIIRIEFDCGFIECTEDHRIYTDSGWKEAKDITDKDKIYRNNHIRMFELQKIISSEKESRNNADIWNRETENVLEEVVIRKIEKINRKDEFSYNIKVNPHHNYFCNGILVHNCDDPLSAEDVTSDTKLDNADFVFSEVIPTRLVDPIRSAIIVIMQRLHERDTSGIILSRNLGYEHLCLPMEFEPLRRCTTSIGFSDPRTEDGELLFPQRFPKEVVERDKKILGIYACNPYEAPVLMGDLSLKPIGEIKIGDEIIGFGERENNINKNKKYGRQHLKKTLVVNIFKSIRPVVKITFESGEVIRCTPDHKWYRKQRKDTENNKGAYRPAKIGSKLARVCDPSLMELSKEDERIAGWIAGFFDGDGSVSSHSKTKGDRNSSSICFYQGAGRNLPICTYLESSLKRFGFEYTYSEDLRKDLKSNFGYGYRQYRLKIDGLPTFQKFLHIVRPNKWKERLISGALGTKFIKKREKVISIEPDGEEEVFALETITGNYVVWGLASSNSAGQFQQRPSPRGGGLIKEEWLSQRFKLLRDGAGKVDLKQFSEIYQSWDTAFKEGEENDYSVCTTWGLKDNKIHLIHLARVKMDFPTLEKRAIELAAHFCPNQILIEDKASGQSLVQAFKRKTRLPVKAVIPQRDKIARVNSVTGYFEAMRVWLPENEPWLIDYIDEMTTFPAGAHDDQVDSTTQFFIQIVLKREASLQALEVTMMSR